MSDLDPEKEKMRRQLAVLASFEQGGGDIAGLALDDVRDMGPAPSADPLPSTPERPPLYAPKVVDLTAQPKGDLDVEAAKGSDRDAFNARAREMAYRQIVAGLTRTDAPEPVTPLGTAEKDLKAKRQQQQLERLREMELGNQGKRLDFDTREAARKAGIDEQRRREDLEQRDWSRQEAARDNERAERGIAASNANAAATRALAGANLALRKDDAEIKKTERDEKRAAGTVPFLSGTLTLRPGLSDSERASARDKASLWTAAEDATGNFQGVLEEFARAPSPATRGRVTAALRTASAAFNSAIGGGAMSMDEARAMSEAMGGDVLSPTGIAAIVEKFMGDDAAAAATISNRVKAARQANRATALGRLKAYGDFSEGKASTPAAAPTDGRTIVRNPKTGERRYLNADGSLGEAVP